MTFRFVHLGSKVQRIAALGLCLVLTGCQSLSSTGSSARVRVIDVSVDAPAVDIYQGPNAVAYNLSFGTVTSYLPVVPGTSAITIDVAGSRQVLASVEGTFAAESHYTVLINAPFTTLQPTILTDHSALSPSKGPAKPAVRFLHQATRTGPVDVYLVPAGHRLASVSPILTNLAPGTNTGYLAVPACTCTVVMLPAGTPPSTAAMSVHSGVQSTYQTGSARTVIVLDAPPSALTSVQVVTAMDVEAPN